MAQQFALNGIILTQGIEANWDENSVGSPLAGGTTFNRYRRHRWQTNVMTAAEFATIRGRLGQVVNLTTTNYSDRNGDFVTYYGAVLDSLRDGGHDGPNFAGVTAEFTVRI